ncbi:iron response transcriptional regulator IrrA [Arhodomonas aquaeolei]|uniref:iron response transcriptional regulator IrrA n=1 Tax=Arhodomonas aquaeolei TaxID=2369 RepID=UPI00036D3A21|nr:Fur family transcriptional regulator [Arhodomonas aquaeolei]
MPTTSINRDQLRTHLRRAGLRATRARLDLATLIFGEGDRHFTAEALHREAGDAAIDVSLATIYNTLNRLAAVGLLQRIVLDSRRTYFDTNTQPHHHLFDEDAGRLEDVPVGAVELNGLPDIPDGTHIESVDIVIRVRRDEA